ncbi:hypothetical protein IE53DRAFT_317770 [Violaceomyces palustris]|uniref:Uncharacterized protein n=1 Tax=Violaceomyces palustris TaxID=1673888 RepID=A0ACD0NUA0_9BASI|nr:hypothetical protein IE53DRAFT_317770 [Violaceomyces palustris]
MQILSASSSSTSTRRERAYQRWPQQNPHMTATVCRISRGFHKAFTKLLYRSVHLDDDWSIECFQRTVSDNPELAALVRHLASGNYVAHDPASAGPTADRILASCPNVTHVFLSRARFLDWSPGLYRMATATEVTLQDVTRSSDLDGLASRHRSNVENALRNNPTISRILGDRSSRLGMNAFPAFSTLAMPMTTSRITAPLLPLTHLHLVSFDGRLIHHLVQISSITHLTLTLPQLPARAPGTPGLSILPRSHLMLLLGSGRLRRIVIRAELRDCARICEELLPIHDDRLRFRPIRFILGGGEQLRETAVNVEQGHDADPAARQVVASEAGPLALRDQRMNPLLLSGGSTGPSHHDDASRSPPVNDPDSSAQTGPGTRMPETSDISVSSDVVGDSGGDYTRDQGPETFSGHDEQQNKRKRGPQTDSDPDTSSRSQNSTREEPPIAPPLSLEGASLLNVPIIPSSSPSSSSSSSANLLTATGGFHYPTLPGFPLPVTPHRRREEAASTTPESQTSFRKGVFGSKRTDVRGATQASLEALLEWLGRFNLAMGVRDEDDERRGFW